MKVHNNQRDGYMRQRIDAGQTSYSPNSLRDGDPVPASEEQGGYVHYAEKVEGNKIRARHESFGDHYSQARLFWNSQADFEKQHIIDAFHFELGKVDNMEVRQRMVEHLSRIDVELAQKVGEGIGVEVPIPIPASWVQSEQREQVPVTGRKSVDQSDALSMTGTRKDTIFSRRVAFLVGEDVDKVNLLKMKLLLTEAGAHVDLISKNQGVLKKTDGEDEVLRVDKSYVTTGSIMYDAVFVPDRMNGKEVQMYVGSAMQFIVEAFKHCKTIGAYGRGVDLLMAARLMNVGMAEQGQDQILADQGVITTRGGDMGEFASSFIQAMNQHRHWERERYSKQIPA